MSSRFLRRLIFGVFYLAVFGGLSYSIYLLGIRGGASCFDGRQNQSELGVDCGGSCVSCELKNLSPISFFGDLRVAGVDWSSAAEFEEPSIQSRNIKIEFPQKDQAKVTGLILNNNSFPLSSADIVVAVSDKLGIKVSASKTVVRDLEPFHERAFNVFLPLRGQFIDSTATKVFVEAIR